jgi:hypothetical protein
MQGKRIEYRFRPKDRKLWQRLIKKAAESKRTINSEIEYALSLHVPEISPSKSN